MNTIDARAFVEFDPNVLQVYCCEQAAELGLAIPGAYLPSVQENLAVLQTHAAILAAYVEGGDPQTSPTAPR